MAYNHRKEEKKWIFWKTQEEKQLRSWEWTRMSVSAAPTCPEKPS